MAARALSRGSVAVCRLTAHICESGGFVRNRQSADFLDADLQGIPRTILRRGETRLTLPLQDGADRPLIIVPCSRAGFVEALFVEGQPRRDVTTGVSRGGDGGGRTARQREPGHHQGAGRDRSL